MSNFYCKQLNDDENSVVLGFRPDDRSVQEARIALRYGANLVQYTYQGHAIIDYDPALLKSSDFTGTPVLYPTPNRVKEGVFVFRGKVYNQVKRGRRVLEHGLVYDEPWELVGANASQTEALLSARILWSPDSRLFCAFPFPHSLMLTFRLMDGAIEIAYKITNLGAHEIPYGFGLHPYFQKRSGESNTLISLPVEQVMEATPELLPTGNLQAVKGTIYDLNAPTPIGSLDLDHVFLRAGKDSAARIYYANQGLHVSIQASNDFSHYVVYSPQGMPYFCLESQTCSTNAHNLYDQGFQDISGLKIVAPGAKQTGWVRYVTAPYQV